MRWFDEFCLCVRKVEQPEVAIHGSWFLAKTQGVLTQQGYQVWESEFQPDWQRWWCIQDDYFNEENHCRTLHVMYAGNEILNDLLVWFPNYWGLDSSFCLQQQTCRTSFQYHVATWKTIPFI